MRAAANDKNIKIIPARKLSLEQALEYINDDELVEVTPINIRLRKMLLTELERRRAHTRNSKEQ
jgi:GTP-binding protein